MTSKLFEPQKSCLLFFRLRTAQAI